MTGSRGLGSVAAGDRPAENPQPVGRADLGTGKAPRPREGRALRVKQPRSPISLPSPPLLSPVSAALLPASVPEGSRHAGTQKLRVGGQYSGIRSGQEEKSHP